MKNNQQNDFSKFLEILCTSDKNQKQQAANSMISNLNQQENEQLGEILKDKEKINQILNSTVAQQILNKIKPGSNGQLK